MPKLNFHTAKLTKIETRSKCFDNFIRRAKPRRLFGRQHSQPPDNYFIRNL